MANVCHRVLDGDWTTSHVQFQSSPDFISLKEFYKQRNSDHVFPLGPRMESVSGSVFRLHGDLGLIVTAGGVGL